MAQPDWEELELFPSTSAFQWQFLVTAAPSREDLIIQTKVLALPQWRLVADRTQYFNRTVPGARNVLFEVWDTMRDPKADWGLQLPPLEVQDDSDPF